MKNRIEQAKEEDIQEIIDLIQSESVYLLPRDYDDIKKSINNFIIIRDNDTIVACAAFENYAPKIAEIRSVVVKPEYRKHGYGKLLVDELLTRALPGQEVFVVTSKVEYFQKIGFHTCLNEKQILFFQKNK